MTEATEVRRSCAQLNPSYNNPEDDAPTDVRIRVYNLKTPNGRKQQDAVDVIIPSDQMGQIVIDWLNDVVRNHTSEMQRADAGVVWG